MELNEKIINNLIKKIEEDMLIIKNNSKDLDKQREIHIKIKQTISMIYKDYKERINDFENSLAIATTREKTRVDFQEDKTQEQRKTMLRYLSAIKEELELKLQSIKEEDKLSNLKEEIEYKKGEAKRREAVTETKFYGAAIEMIDQLRTELKRKDKLMEEVLFIKKEIEIIKDILNKKLNN